jgi:hypothetical protein
MICTLARFGQMTIEYHPKDAGAADSPSSPFKGSPFGLTRMYAASATPEGLWHAGIQDLNMAKRSLIRGLSQGHWRLTSKYWRWFARLKLSISAARPASTKNAERGWGQLREAALTSPAERSQRSKLVLRTEAPHTKP